MPIYIVGSASSVWCKFDLKHVTFKMF
jgi:hypothetical protein